MNISILGCGWLGLPLAETLIKQGHAVYGSTTTKEKLPLLSEKNITPSLIKLNPQLEGQDDNEFWNTDLLILNIPPGRGNDNVVDFFTSQISSVAEKLETSSIDKVLFASSTSVYPEQSGVVKESDAILGKAARSSGNALIRAENMLQSNEHFGTTILRFGGLYGYDRHPVKYLSGKKNLDKGNAPVNLIHRDDCIAIITKIMEKPFIGEAFNAVSDGHPPQKMYYKAAAEKLGLEPPTFKKDSAKDHKVVSNRKLKKHLEYNFKHPNPMDLAINIGVEI